MPPKVKQLNTGDLTQTDINKAKKKKAKKEGKVEYVRDKVLEAPYNYVCIFKYIPKTGKWKKSYVTYNAAGLLRSSSGFVLQTPYLITYDKPYTISRGARKGTVLPAGRTRAAGFGIILRTAAMICAIDRFKNDEGGISIKDGKNFNTTFLSYLREEFQSAKTSTGVNRLVDAGYIQNLQYAYVVKNMIVYLDATSTFDYIRPDDATAGQVTQISMNSYVPPENLTRQRIQPLAKGVKVTPKGTPKTYPGITVTRSKPKVTSQQQQIPQLPLDERFIDVESGFAPAQSRGFHTPGQPY